MNYQILYHELMRRRKIEIDLCHKSILAATRLYEKVIEFDEQGSNLQLNKIRMLCNDACSALDEAYEELLYTDTIIEEMSMDKNINTTIIYTINPLNERCDNNTDGDNNTHEY